MCGPAMLERRFRFSPLSLPVMNPFLSACGATEPLQLRVERPGTAEVQCRSFDTPFVLIGRDPLSDLQLLHGAVSARHAYLQAVGGRLFCSDLGSRQGTYLAGKRWRSGWVGPEQAIRVGPYRIRLVRGDGLAPSGTEPELTLPADGFAPPDSLGTNPAPLTLELSHRALSSLQCQVHSAMVVVGSAADCQARLLDPSVSNYHCSLIRTSLGCWVVDLLGRGGISVNGVSIRYGQVYDGDDLQLGHSRIRFRLDPAESRIPAPASRLVPAPPPPPGPIPVESPTLAAGPGAWARASAGPSEPGQSLARMTPDRAEVVESIVAPLMSQFRAMQKQMVEEFQEAGMILFETFSTLHEEQLGMIREELSNLRQLTQELEALRRDLAKPCRAKTLLEPGLDTAPPLHDRPGTQDEGDPPPAMYGRQLEADIHALLYQRLSSLQDHRRSRWQKLLDLAPAQRRRKL
jgi:pSer/pThr/pTyr-binding forkhead associated (FHA) protein